MAVVPAGLKINRFGVISKEWRLITDCSLGYVSVDEVAVATAEFLLAHPGVPP